MGELMRRRLGRRIERRSRLVGLTTPNVTNNTRLEFRLTVTVGRFVDERSSQLPEFAEHSSLSLSGISSFYQEVQIASTPKL